MALFDADADAANGRFADDVEAVRAGYILARNPKAYTTWRRSIDRAAGRKPVGKSLRDLAKDFGTSVVVGDFEFRN